MVAREQNFALGAKETRIFLVTHIREGIEEIYWQYEMHDYNLYNILCSGKTNKKKATIFDYYPYWCANIDQLLKAKKWFDEDFKRTAKNCLSSIPKYLPTPGAEDMVAEGEYNKFLFQKAMKHTIIEKKLRELKDSWNRREKAVDPPPDEINLEPYWESQS